MLVNLALGVGLMMGYLAWGREASRVERELALSRQRGFTIGRDETLKSQGVIRAVLPEQHARWHQAQRRDAKLLEGLEPGDIVRFTLRGIPPNLEVTELTRVGKT